MGDVYLGKIDAKGAHVQAVQEGRKVLVEATQTLVQQLQVHHVGLKIGHAVAQLREGRLQPGQREVGGGEGGEAAAGCCLGGAQ